MRAVGYWSYEKEVPVTKEDVQRNNNNGSSKVGSATTTVCVDYDTTLAQHPELNSALPSSSTLQVYALMATSFYCVAFFVGVIFIVILSIHSEEFDEDEQYPMRGVLITQSQWERVSSQVRQSFISYRCMDYYTITAIITAQILPDRQ